MFCILVAFIVVIIRLVSLQIIDGAEIPEAFREQQHSLTNDSAFKGINLGSQREIAGR